MSGDPGTVDREPVCGAIVGGRDWHGYKEVSL